MIVTTAQLFKVAYGDFAVGAYNINNMEQALGLFQGHIDAQAPFIIQLSKGARKYANARVLEAIIRAVEAEYPDAIFAVHLDHGDEQTCYDCIDSGFYSSVMIDASHEPFEENVAITRRVVERAHARGLSVESELGKLGGVEEDIQVDEKHAMLTDPDEAKLFVEQSGCDSLAVAIGTSHGAYKFSGSQGLHFDRIEAIQQVLPGFPLVMHGSSSVPQGEVARINAAGGKLDPSAKGVDDNQFARAAKLGVTKVNIDTDGRLVWTRVHREFFRDHPEGFDFRTPGKEYVKAYADFIVDKSRKLGSYGQLDKVRAAVS
ncbi:MAG: class II fructose-bisphosphate aldolase [Candidatus Promineofilum sp.]|nr:class II fructose-bisphosphate aldolase [Promineifilum sp.]MCW5864626.1 class II fructose-bisphosphate aldolase [Anaerolineae bacterium]